MLSSLDRLIRTAELNLKMLFILNFHQNWTALNNCTLSFGECSPVFKEMLKKDCVFYKDADIFQLQKFQRPNKRRKNFCLIQNYKKQWKSLMNSF
jgi:hypothetical protein